MPIDPSERVKFLNQIHLFNGLDEVQFTAIANEFKEVSYPAGKEIVQQGVADDRLCLIWSGKVTVSRSGKQPWSATLVSGDHFGDEAMLIEHHRQVPSATAVEDTTVLLLTRQQFQALAQQAPCLKTNIIAAINRDRKSVV